MSKEPAFPFRLIEGYMHFRNESYEDLKQRYASLEKEQKPEILLISCCDSRVPPELIFDARPGELFVVRNVANLVPPYESDGHYHGTSSAIEYAVQSLGVKSIVILGHTDCGGIKASVRTGGPLTPDDFIGQWVSLISPAIERLSAEKNSEHYLRELEYEMIRQSLVNLQTFPFIRKHLNEGRLGLYGAHFSIKTGQLLVLNSETQQFEPPFEIRVSTQP